jgi:hypothetical protein
MRTVKVLSIQCCANRAPKKTIAIEATCHILSAAGGAKTEIPVDTFIHERFFEPASASVESFFEANREILFLHFRGELFHNSCGARVL